jgi:lysophospholipid acyltransferase (LPLAT)-like uncharacterized protein
MGAGEARAQAVGWLGAGLLRALGATWRTRTVGAEHEEACRTSGGGFLYAFWHGNLLPLAYLRRRRGVVVLVSQNRDGEYITQVIHREGFRTVRGSSSRGGFRSLIEMSRLGQAGTPLAITPDGPRGPRHRAQPGVLLLAQRAGVPILPTAVGAWPRRRLDSWDRFLIPAPFARVVMGFGRPLSLPGELDAETLIARWTEPVERALTDLEDRCEREVRAWAGLPATAAESPEDARRA